MIEKYFFEAYQDLELDILLRSSTFQLMKAYEEEGLKESYSVREQVSLDEIAKRKWTSPRWTKLEWGAVSLYTQSVAIGNCIRMWDESLCLDRAHPEVRAWSDNEQSESCATLASAEVNEIRKYESVTFLTG